MRNCLVPPPAGKALAVGERIGEPALRMRRWGKRSHPIDDGRCAPLGEARLSDGIQICPVRLRADAVSLDDIRWSPSRQGDLRGERLHASGLQAEATRHSKETTQ